LYLKALNNDFSAPNSCMVPAGNLDNFSKLPVISNILQVISVPAVLYKFG